jgi:trehalose-6-phosphate synthase
VINEPMQRLLNRGLNFSILPPKLDITQTLAEYKAYERAVIWHEFHYGKEENKDVKEHIFKETKTNMPKNYLSLKDSKYF